MLAATAERIEDIGYPCCATPKIDGIRALTIGGKFRTRSFKLVQNAHIQSHAPLLPEGLDGELIVGSTFQSTTSGVMSRQGQPDFTYMVFDQYGDANYWTRIFSIPALPQWCQVLVPVVAFDAAGLLAYEAQQLALGYEGIMLRSAHGPYHCGRATLRSQWLTKFKRFVDSEAICIGYKEGMTNENPIVRNVFGYAERPGGAAGRVARGTLGGLVCRDVSTGVEVSVGSGFTEELRAELWAERDSLPGRVVKYRYQPTGVKDAPRFPTFLGFRHPDDA